VTLMATGLVILSFAHSLPWLIVARFFQGAGVGLTIGVSTAAFVESYRGKLPSGGAIQAISAIGLMGGPVLSAIFFNLGGGVNWSYVPTLLLVIGLVAMVQFIPHRALNANATAVDTVLESAVVRSGLRFAIPVVFVSWAGLGLFFSLVPAYLATSLHADNPAIGALAVVAAQLSSLAAVFGFGKVAPQRSGVIAPVVMIAGLAALVAGTTLNIWPLVIGATVLVGAGGGVAAAAAFAIAGRIAVGQRTRIFARMYVAAYLGYTVPTLAVGIIAVHSSLFVGFSVVTVVIGLITAVFPALRERPARTASVTPIPVAA
jgi:MFS family permease